MNDWKTIDLKDYISKEGSPWNCFETIPMRHYVDDKKTEYTATCPVCHDNGSSLHVRWERFQKKVSFYCDRGHSLENILNAFGIKTKTEQMKKKEEIKKKARRERRKLNGEDRKSRKATTEKGVETGIILVRPNLPVEDAKLDLKIDEEFHNLIPPISKDEYWQLADNILFGGCRDPIVVWDGIIIDGHNRYEICQKHCIEFKTLEKSFDSRDDAKIWIIRNQLGRRNISDYNRAKLALELKPMIAAKARGRMLSGKADPMQKSAQGSTREELAMIAGVSHDTIHKIEVIKKKGTPEVKEAADRGQISINKAYKATVRKPEVKKLKLGPPSNAMQFAKKAILDLKKITDDDLEREKAFDSVYQWIQDIIFPIYVERRAREAEEDKKKEEEISPLLEKDEEKLSKEEKAKVDAYWENMPSKYYLHKEKFEQCEEAWRELSKSQKKEFVKRHCEKEVNP